MKKFIIAGLVIIIVALMIMVFFNKPHLSLAIGAFGFIFFCLAAAKYENSIPDRYKDSNILMCSEGVIRHIKLLK